MDVAADKFMKNSIALHEIAVEQKLLSCFELMFLADLVLYRSNSISILPVARKTQCDYISFSI
jgi:hypothetical protein